MSRRINELFLFDIYVAILKIGIVSDKFDSSEELLHDFISWDSVIREFEIIGESTNILIKNNILAEENRIIVDFRNLLIHNYFGIDPDEIWNVIHDDLILFREKILKKISELDKELKNEIIESLIEEYRYIKLVVEKLEKLKL